MSMCVARVCNFTVFGVCVCAGIFHQTLTKPKLGLDKKLLAETVVPFLLPISIEPSLNLKQVKAGRMLPQMNVALNNKCCPV